MAEQDLKDLENVEATELDDKDLEDASGGAALDEEVGSNNNNCNC
jgi:hypothetical protein